MGSKNYTVTNFKPRYDYSLLRIDYHDRLPVGNDIIRIICSEHGEFSENYNLHKKSKKKYRCQKCVENELNTLKALCINDALKYDTRFEWQKKSPLYQHAKKHKWLEECCKEMLPLRNSWTKEMCKEIALKFQSKKMWEKKSGGSYKAACVNNWIDECCEHMNNIFGIWKIKDNVLNEALKFKTVSEWCKKSSGSYDSALKHGWFNEAKLHMIDGRKRNH